MCNMKIIFSVLRFFSAAVLLLFCVLSSVKNKVPTIISNIVISLNDKHYLNNQILGYGFFAVCNILHVYFCMINS
ncbi:Protein of unknown function [Gryllus bimaculatus]|nr:Protein of unknown function [Gryllus bimaculatus]